MWGLANTNTNDNASSFLDLLYGPHKGMSNLGRFDLPEFNALYDRAKRLPNGPERVKLYREMSRLVVELHALGTSGQSLRPMRRAR